MDEGKQEKEKKHMLPVINEVETKKDTELYQQEVWDEAIRSYNEVLFGLLKYL